MKEEAFDFSKPFASIGTQAETLDRAEIDTADISCVDPRVLARVFDRFYPSLFHRTIRANLPPSQPGHARVERLRSNDLERALTRADRRIVQTTLAASTLQVHGLRGTGGARRGRRSRQRFRNGRGAVHEAEPDDASWLSSADPSVAASRSGVGATRSLRGTKRARLAPARRDRLGDSGRRKRTAAGDRYRRTGTLGGTARSTEVKRRRDRSLHHATGGAGSKPARR